MPLEFTATESSSLEDVVISFHEKSSVSTNLKNSLWQQLFCTIPSSSSDMEIWVISKKKAKKNLAAVIRKLNRNHVLDIVFIQTWKSGSLAKRKQKKNLAAVIKKLNRNHVLDIVFWESFFCCFCEETIIHQHCSHICKTQNTHTFCEKKHTYFHFPSLFSSSSSSCEKRLDSSKSYSKCTSPAIKQQLFLLLNTSSKKSNRPLGTFLGTSTDRQTVRAKVGTWNLEWGSVLQQNVSGEGWNLEWGSVLQQNVTSRTDGREDIVNLYIRFSHS